MGGKETDMTAITCGKEDVTAITGGKDEYVTAITGDKEDVTAITGSEDKYVTTMTGDKDDVTAIMGGKEDYVTAIMGGKEDDVTAITGGKGADDHGVTVAMDDKENKVSKGTKKAGGDKYQNPEGNGEPALLSRESVKRSESCSVMLTSELWDHVESNHGIERSVHVCACKEYSDENSNCAGTRTSVINHNR